MADATRPWSGADTSESTSQLNDAVAAAKKDLDGAESTAPSAPAPVVASRPKRVASAKTPPSQRLEAAAPPPQIAQLVDDDDSAAAASAAQTDVSGEGGPTALPSPALPAAVRRGVSPTFVRGRATELQTNAQLIRGDLRDLKKLVRSTFAAGFAEMKDLVSTRVLRLRPKFQKEHRRELRGQVNGLRQDTECLRTAVAESFSAIANDLSDLSQQLAVIANNQPEPAVAERQAIRRLHGAIDALICEGGVGTELDRTHHDARMAKIKAARELRNEIAARPTARITADSQAPATSPVKRGTVRDDDPSGGVDDLAMPHPTDVLPAMYGARTWKLHAPSLQEAVPYAVNALEALKNATHKNSKARDLLQLRIARQERDIHVLQSSKAATEKVLSRHVESLQGVLARVADGRVIRQRVPEASDPDVVEQLQAVSATVEQFIEHLAYVAERHAQAAKRGQTVDIPDAKMGLVPSAPAQPRVSATEETRARLFPDAEKSARLQGQLAILRRKHVQLRFRAALQTWRFRRCAYALAQRHDRLSAQEATEAQNAVFDEAIADMVKAAHVPAGDPSLEGADAVETTTEIGGAVAESDDQTSAAVAAPSDAADAELASLPPPPPPPKVLAADDAIRRLERASVLPSPGLDSLLEVVEAKAADEAFRFERRAEAAQESWRARRAKDALERFRNSQHSGVAPEPSKVLLELGGGHEEMPTVFSALPPPSTGPRFQKPTQVSATKARLRPISQPGAPRANNGAEPRAPAATARKPFVARGRGPPATAPVPAANSGFGSRSAPDALRNVPISDALGAFLAEAHTRPQTHHYASRGPRLS